MTYVDLGTRLARGLLTRTKQETGQSQVLPFLSWSQVYIAGIAYYDPTFAEAVAGDPDLAQCSVRQVQVIVSVPDTAQHL